MAKRIILDLWGQQIAGDMRRPSDIVRDLGFTYREARGEPIADRFIFEDCANIPDSMPDWLTVHDR